MQHKNDKEPTPASYETNMEQQTIIFKWLLLICLLKFKKNKKKSTEIFDKYEHSLLKILWTLSLHKL